MLACSLAFLSFGTLQKDKSNSVCCFSWFCCSADRIGSNVNLGRLVRRSLLLLFLLLGLDLLRRLHAGAQNTTTKWGAGKMDGSSEEGRKVMGYAQSACMFVLSVTLNLSSPSAWSRVNHTNCIVLLHHADCCCCQPLPIRRMRRVLRALTRGRPKFTKCGCEEHPVQQESGATAVFNEHLEHSHLTPTAVTPNCVVAKQSMYPQNMFM